MEKARLNISIVIPVYNDWRNLRYLVGHINQEAKKNNFKVSKIIVVNDFSTSKPQYILDIESSLHYIHLNNNVGHQRAIAIGLAYLNNLPGLNSNCVIIMDADGQDLPQYIKPLAEKAITENKLVFANRKKRSESFSFIVLYRIYRALFKILTGYNAPFGNYSCFPTEILEDIIANPNLWNHYSSSLLKSKVPLDYINTQRGKRLLGESKMNFNQLLMHGLSSISVHIDQVITKVLLLSLSGILILIVLFLSLFSIKIFSAYAIPGWTSNIALALLNIGGILSIIILLLLLMQLNQRRQLSPSVKNLYEDFIKSIKVVNK